MAIEVDNLFEAVDIIVHERLKNISYDTTDICIIIDDSDAKNGKYKVSTNNGETTYFAYSESDEYENGESVRVSIPNGDYSQKKYIEGKCVVDDAITPITYVSPLNTVIDVTGNMLSEQKQSAQFGLITNGATAQVPIWSADLALDKSYKDLQASGIYNTIAISAQFKTLLSNYDMRAGNYGLRLDVYVKVNPQSDKYIVRSVYLDSAEMFGNPYNFMIYSPQAKKFDLSTIGTVEKLSLWLYQEGNFTHYNAAKQETETINADNIHKNNIIAKNVKVFFGSDLSVIADNTLQSYTISSPEYRLIATKADNEKSFGFLWYNKDEDNQYLGFSDGVVEFETDEGGEVVYTNKLNKDWTVHTEDVLDENGKPILEFAKDSKGNVALVSVRDKNGKEVVVTDLVKAKTDLANEKTSLLEDLQKEFQNEEITLEEYTARTKDVNGYYSVKLKYLETDYRDEAAEQAAAEKRSKAIADLDALKSANQITSSEYNKELAAIEEEYSSTITKIYNHRIEKTYVLQHQQKEILVPKVKVYDEIDYLERSEQDARLVAQSGRENIPSDAKSLNLAANVAEARPLLDKTCDLVTKDLYAVLNQMRTRTSAIAEIKSKLDTMLVTPKADYDGYLTPGDGENLSAFYTTVDKLRGELIDVYTQFLRYNYRVQENQKKLAAERENITFNDKEEALRNWHSSKHNLSLAIESAFEDKLFVMIEDFFEEVQQVITDNYSGYQGIYDTYYKNAYKVIRSIEENLKKLHALLSKDRDVMLTMPPFVNNYVYLDYQQQDFSGDSNKYSIYWYRYKPGYTSDDRLISAEWERLTTKHDFGIEEGSTEPVYNYGLPIYDDFILRDGRYYFSAKSLDTNSLATRMMDGRSVKEKYKIILFYNHEMYESNELVFTNLDDVPDPTTVDKTDAIYIVHESNSQESYQLYGINTYLNNLADASKVRTISVHYNGLLAGDETLAGAQVYWYVPNSATMLVCDDKYLTSQLGFYSDINIADDMKPDYSKEGYTCYYKSINSEEIDVADDPETKDIDESGKMVTAKADDLKFVYKIRESYEENNSRNDIICKVVKDEYTFETEVFFTFATFGTSGTDYTLIIRPQTTQVAVTPTEVLSLDIILKDYKNSEIPISDKKLDMNGASDFKIEWEGPTSYQAVYYENNSGGMIADVQASSSPGENDSLLHGIMKVSVNCPIEYDNGGDEFGDASEDSETATKPATRNVILTAYRPIPYSAGDYYIEGASTVVYDSMGSNPTYFKDPYRIFRNNTNQDLAEIKKLDHFGQPTEENRYDIKWRIVYYKNEKGRVIKLDKETHSDYNICRNYMPTLNEKGGLNPTNMYVEDMNCWCAVECWIKDLDLPEKDEKRKYSLIWIQPILIIKNRYPSPMLNSWDGSLTIDKKNGTILSSLVGAGRKTIHNTFEGVLIGDVEGGAGVYDADNKSGLGIYGFNDGAQSFGFNVDGTGFIGKSGRGRIKFNGSTGTIESASYTEGNHPYGMRIDFDDGFIDMKGGVEYQDEDWINLIIEKYNETLACRKKVYNETLQQWESSLTEYVVDVKIVPLAVQKDLALKIAYDAQHLNILYQEQRDLVWNAYQKGDIDQVTYENYTNQINKKVSENKYYALTTLENAKLRGSFSVNKEVDGETQTVEHEFTTTYYNTIVNELDEAVLAQTYDGEAIAAELNYKTRYGSLAKALEEAESQVQTIIDEKNNIVSSETVELANQSHVHLDVKSPYFYVVSEQGKRIINIGDDTSFNFADYPYAIDDSGKISFYGTSAQKAKWLEPYGTSLSKGYYLKSNDFTYSDFSTNDGDPSARGSGFLLDLTNGHINAFNLSISSKNVFIDSTENADPFFIVKDNDGCNLIYVGTEKFYIQSHSYSEYLRGITKDDGTYSPAIRINFATTTNMLMNIRGQNQALFYVGSKNYYLQSDDFVEASSGVYGKGMKIDLREGSLLGYNFSLRGENGKETDPQVGSYIQMTSDPLFQIHLKEKVDNSTRDIDLIKISPSTCVMHSPDWNSGSTTTKTTTTATVKVNSLRVRCGPGTDYDIVGSVSRDDTFVVYGSSVNGWWSMESSRNQGDGQWVCEEMDGTTYLTISTTTEEVSSGDPSGMQIDVYRGRIIMNKPDSDGNEPRQLRINVGAKTYPFQLGKLLPGKDVRNFRISWNGAVYGGSTYSWSISDNGTATFNKLNANSGSLNYMSIDNVTIGSGKIGGCTIESGKIYGSGWSLTSGKITVTSGSIGGCAINSNGISGSKWSLKSDGYATFTGITMGNYILDVENINYDAWVPSYTTGGTSGDNAVYVYGGYLTNFVQVYDTSGNAVSVPTSITFNKANFVHKVRHAVVIAANVKEDK